MNIYKRIYTIKSGKNKLNSFIDISTGRQLRVVFNILVDWKGFRSLLDLSLYGLSKESASIISSHNQIAFSGGYEDRTALLFHGEIINVQKERHGPDAVTRIYARSGPAGLAKSTISKTLGEGAPLPEVIKACADAMSLPLIVNGIEPGVAFSGGYTLFGDPKKHLAELSKTHRFDWVVENNKLVVVGNKSKRPGKAHRISMLTGMEGSPEITGGGKTEVEAKVKVRLNPGIKIGQLFEIISEYPRANFSGVYYNNIPKTVGEGTYKVHRIEHSGDSHGDEWSTKLTGLRFLNNE